jgi:hypothetical protein
MAYRMDWRVILRTNRRESAQRLLNRLRKALKEDISITTFEPWAEHGQMWDCRFSMGTMNITWPEAVLKCMHTTNSIGDMQFKMSTDGEEFNAYFHKNHTWLTGLNIAEVSLLPADAPVVAGNIEQDIVAPKETDYKLWIEAEMWHVGINRENEINLNPELLNKWSSDDENSDILVEFSNGTRWEATFFTFLNIENLRKKNQQTGENLNGKYFEGDNTVIIDKLSRPDIRKVIDNMIQQGTFDMVFRWTGVDETGTGDD